MNRTIVTNQDCAVCDHSKRYHKPKKPEHRWDIYDCKAKSEYNDYEDGLCHCEEFEYRIDQEENGYGRIHCVKCGKICCYEDSGSMADTANDVKVYCPKCYEKEKKR